jgi:hypothetical protein
MSSVVRRWAWPNCTQIINLHILVHTSRASYYDAVDQLAKHIFPPIMQVQVGDYRVLQTLNGKTIML